MRKGANGGGICHHAKEPGSAKVSGSEPPFQGERPGSEPPCLQQNIVSQSGERPGRFQQHRLGSRQLRALHGRVVSLLNWDLTRMTEPSSTIHPEEVTI